MRRLRGLFLLGWVGLVLGFYAFARIPPETMRSITEPPGLDLPHFLRDVHAAVRHLVYRDYVF